MTKDSSISCNQCKVCLKSCILIRYDSTSIASILNKVAKDCSWSCTNCWRCVEDCPIGFDIIGFMRDIRRYKDSPSDIKKGINMVLSKGYFLDVKSINELRESFNLKPFIFYNEKQIKMLLK